jgi:thiamine-monophosphate kinase
MCDVSDGLVADLGHIARASGVAAGLHSGRLREAASGMDLRHVLTGGEDHALVATLPAGTPLPSGVTVIGRVDPGPVGVLLDGEPTTGGWEHFR